MTTTTPIIRNRSRRKSIERREAKAARRAAAERTGQHRTRSTTHRPNPKLATERALWRRRHIARSRGRGMERPGTSRPLNAAERDRRHRKAKASRAANRARLQRA